MNAPGSFNTTARNWNRKRRYAQKKAVEWRVKGLCIRCGGDSARVQTHFGHAIGKPRAHCKTCLAYFREIQRARKLSCQAVTTTTTA